MSTEVLTGLHFELGEDQQLIKESVKDFVERYVAPGVMERDENHEFPHEIIRMMAEQNLMGMVFDEKYGGGGIDTVSFTLALEEIARWDASLALTIGSHTSLCSGHINMAGTEAQKEKYLTQLATGEKLGGWALTEPGSGSDSSGLKTTAVKKGGQWILNGTKTFITQGSVGGIFIVLALTDPAKGAKGISAFIVDKGAPGFRHGKKMKKLGMNSTDTAELIMEDCAIPEENLLGELNKGFFDTMKILNSGRIGIGAMAVGITRGCLEESLSYSAERRQFGKPIGQNQALQWMMVDMATQNEAARLMVHRAAWLKDQARPYTKEASMGKLFASELCTQSALKAIQIHGGYGYIKEYHVERFLRDAKLLEIGEGTSEVQRMIIAKHLQQ
ncbi:MAG: acyl-CoA dehydrogenase family protein [Balneolales bacterium]